MALHNIEKKVLLGLKEKEKQTIEELTETASLDSASINHASAWLQAKGLVKITEQIEKNIELGKEGKDYLANGLPERKALKLLSADKGISVKEAREIMGNEANIALAWLMKEGIAKVDNGTIKITPQAKQFLKRKLPQEKALEKISQGEEISQQLEKILKKRGNIIVIHEIKTQTIQLTAKGNERIKQGIEVTEEISQLTPEMLKTGAWKNKKLREYNVEMPVEKTYPGRRHPVMQAVDHAKRVWLEMGFKEMRGPLIDSEFWVFDSLFIPQNHPAREMQDTLFVEGKQKLNKKLLKNVEEAHEKGVDGSKGLNYKFDPKISERLVMRTHTTCISARVLSELKKSDWPAKLFAVGRVFRNETIDWKHGFEFNQSEGIVVDPDANFQNLMGYLKEFYNKLGYDNYRFKPKYYPYTEMSLTVEVYNKEHNEWYELGGAGIFRPEVVEPLLGEAVPVLAWGPGLDRMFQEYYDFKRFNEIYKNDVKKLREVPQWMR